MDNKKVTEIESEARLWEIREEGDKRKNESIVKVLSVLDLCV